jgi:hypothetical protein
VLLLAFCWAGWVALPAQPQAPPVQQSTSFADTLRHSQGKELHIFYIHGIGSDGPDDFDSLALRKSLCKFLKDCTTEAGTAIGEWDYANHDEFAPDAQAPDLHFIDEPVWKNQEEWRAAAPYSIHFQLVRRGGSTLYVDELNWWPLTFSLKCRQIIASEADLVGPNKVRIPVCSRRQPNAEVPLRFKSYDWIDKDAAARLLKKPSHGARLNRDLKSGLMDWGFSDAVMLLGPLRPYVLSGIRQLILKSLSDSAASKALAPDERPRNEEFVIVSHSLGSYLMFAALDAHLSQLQTSEINPSDKSFDQILARTSFVFFFANQLRILQLAGLDGPSDRNLSTHLEAWGKTRCDYLKTIDPSHQCQLPRITALNDPSDLLTWTVPSLSSVEVENYSVKNSAHWFWLIENPTPAHNRYANQRRGIQKMLEEHPQNSR